MLQVKALDMAVRRAHPEWLEDTIQNWPKTSLMMEQQSDMLVWFSVFSLLVTCVSVPLYVEV